MTFPPEPIWAPLQQVTPEAWWGDFMFMGLAEQPDVSLALYKHVHTRDYLNIDAQGQCYRFWHGPVVEEDSVMPVEYGCMDCGWRGVEPPRRHELVHRGPGAGRFTAAYCPRCDFSVLPAEQIDWSRVTPRTTEED